jgi:hypothetical protein
MSSKQVNADACGLTVPEVARRYRIREDKVRGLIRRGELAAVNTCGQRCGRPRFVITREALADFEKAWAAQTDTPNRARPKRLPKGTIDFFPD